MTGVFKRRGKAERDRRRPWEDVAKTEVMLPWNHQKLEEAKKDAPLEPLEGVRPRQGLNFGFLTTTVKEQNSGVSSHVEFAAHCYSNLKKLMRGV